MYCCFSYLLSSFLSILNLDSPLSSFPYSHTCPPVGCGGEAGLDPVGVLLPVAIRFGVFFPDGPNVAGEGISPFDPPSANEVMYALIGTLALQAVQSG
jgi:hypothetical protein